MVRLREETRRLLQEMAAADQVPIQEVAARAVEAYRRQRLLDQINADFAALRADPEAWQGYRDELAAWDSTLLDGLD
jgi:predicted kinase